MVLLFDVNDTKGVSAFEFTRGLTTNNFSVVCWGPGWFNNNGSDTMLASNACSGAVTGSSTTAAGAAGF